MPAVEMSVILRRPVREVFQYLANLENDAAWRREWVEARNCSDGSLGVGATFCLVGKSLGKRFQVEYQVTAYDVDRTAAWQTLSGPLPLAFQRTFEPAADGGTRVTFRYDMEPSGLLKLAGPLLARVGKRQLEGDLPRLRELLGTTAH